MSSGQIAMNLDGDCDESTYDARRFESFGYGGSFVMREGVI